MLPYINAQTRMHRQGECTDTNAHKCTGRVSDRSFMKNYIRYKYIPELRRFISVTHIHEKYFFDILLIYLILLLHNANLTAMCIICIIYPEHLWIRKMINNQPDIIHDIQEVFFHFFSEACTCLFTVHCGYQCYMGRRCLVNFIKQPCNWFYKQYGLLKLWNMGFVFSMTVGIVNWPPF